MALIQQAFKYVHNFKLTSYPTAVIKINMGLNALRIRV